MSYFFTRKIQSRRNRAMDMKMIPSRLDAVSQNKKALQAILA